MLNKRETGDTTARKAALAGGGIGLSLFAVYGVMEASFIGGVIGLNIAGFLLGFPVESAMLSRAIVSIGMLGGILLTALAFVAAGTVAGWLMGKAVDIASDSLHKNRNTVHPVRN